MNPIFILLVIIGAILLWMLLSVIWIPFGKFLEDKRKSMADKLNQQDKKQAEGENEE